MALRDTLRKWLLGQTNGNALMPPDRAGNPDFVERGFVGPTNMPKVVVEPAQRGVGPEGSRQTAVGSRQRSTKAERQQARENVDVDQNAQGLSGTANLAGFVEDIGEYDPKMRGLQAIQHYDKMRRTDAAVWAAESARRLPILAADWDIQPGADDSISKEAAKLAKENLMGGLESETASGEKHTQTFEQVLRNAMLCDPYGCSAHEDLWTVDADKSQIRLRRLAPRLARTFYQFVTEPDGETLYQLIQFGYRGQMVEIVPVDAWKICYFGLNSEGANFYGWSMNRTAYLPWYFKQQMMRIDAIGAERNRLAVPVVEQGPNADDDDVAQSWRWVENLSTNERTGLSLPYQWKFALQGIEGRAVDLVPSIRFYDEQILLATMTDFLSLGKTESGSRALGDVKLDFFLLAEEAMARFIAKTLESTTVRRLVDHNFEFKSGRTFAYPRVVCQNIPTINFMDALSVVKDLAAANVGMLETTADRDNYIARKLGLPPVSGTPRPKYAPITRTIREEETGSEPIPDEDAPSGGAEPGDTGVAGGLDSGKASQKAKGKGQKAKGEEQNTSLAAEGSALTPNRELKPHEKKHDFMGHVRRADTTARQVARVLRRAKSAAIQALAQHAATLPVSQLGELRAAFDHNLAARVEKTLKVAHDFGYDQVYAERYRATGRGKSTPIRHSTFHMAEAGRLPKKNVQFIAQAAISDFQNWLTGRVKGAAVDAAKTGETGSGLENAIIDDLLKGSDGFLDRIGDEAARVAVAGGRMNALGEVAPEVESYVRSEVMDKGTEDCDEAGGGCWAGDGTEWKSYDAIDWQPGDDCAGKDACRGQIIPVFEDEGAVVLE